MNRAVEDALKGTAGTPHNNNRFVTEADILTRQPLAHAASHEAGGSDPIELHAFATDDPTDDGWWMVHEIIGGLDVITLKARVNGVTVPVAQVEIPT